MLVLAGLCHDPVPSKLKVAGSNPAGVATFNCRLLLTESAPGRMSAGPVQAAPNSLPERRQHARHGHPAFRHSHQIAAASKRQAPKGSGTRNMPHVASATGELILRKFVMSSGPPASGQGRILNKVLMPCAGNDWRMVNAPPHG